MDNKVAEFMLLASKFEFFLINHDIDFAHTEESDQRVIGVNWQRVGQALERKHPFNEFDFASCGFQMLRDTVPQRLFVDKNRSLKWDSEQVEVGSWEILLRRSYAQIRNNVAHGNKAYIPAPFTSERTLQFFEAGTCLMTFVAETVFSCNNWKDSICFQ